MDNAEVWWAAKALERASMMDLVWFQLGMLYVIYGLAMGNTEKDMLEIASDNDPNGAELSRRIMAWHERVIDVEREELEKSA